MEPTTTKPYYIYDLECYPNIFLFCGKFRGSDEIRLYEISDRRNDIESLIQWLSYLRATGVEMVGFNNIGYDYFLIHELMTNPHTFTYEKAHQVSNQIIHSQQRRGGLNNIYFKDRIIPQIDIVKYCHFDNDAKRTSLKALQFAMRSESLEDLPFKIRALTDEEKDRLREYNIHDVTETEKFFNITENAVNMRREFLEDGVLFGDVLNFSDVKIGVEYLISRIGRNKCFTGSKPRQTFRSSIVYNEVILPKINFKTPKYEEVLNWFKQQVIYMNSNEPKPHLKTQLAGIEFHYGAGGVHASASNKIFVSDDEYSIIDIDVAGMYVAVGIANKFAPEHLGESFVQAYSQIKSDRKKYPKGSARNAALKLAGNGAYGNSNNVYSPLYDPKYTFTVTLNGQLQLTQLVEMIELLPKTELIQANTDGITVRVHKDTIPFFNMWRKVWEDETFLELEEVRYTKMWIRDVNNYIAQKEDGSLKLKGAYWFPESLLDYSEPVMSWHKNFSNLASIKTVVRAMVNDWSIEMAVKLVTDPFDFMCRYKATGESRIFIGDEEQLKTVRYYVSISGKPMKKVSPPKGEIGQYKRKNGLKDDFFNSVIKEIGKDVWDERIHTKNKSKYSITESSIEAGWLVKQCNKASDFDWNDVDWKYYIEEAKKLIIGSK